MHRILLLPILLLWFVSAFAGVSGNNRAEKTPVPTHASRVYELDYVVRIIPGEGSARLTLTLRQPRDLLRKLSFSYPPSRYSGFAGDGVIEDTGSELTWQPPATGGSLSFNLVINHKRGRDGRFDSLAQDKWAIFRGDDLLPPVRVIALKGAESKARLRLDTPADWSLISAYPRSKSDPDWFEVEWADRKFDRPVGWMAAGKLAVRWGNIAGTRVAVVSPWGQGIRQMDMLAFLRWNLPTLESIFPAFPKRFMIISAGDPMWRGGLSGPNSLYIHADRPLISGNGTSTLLHELVHLAQAYRAEPGDDWIVEAMAEFYTLEIMRRSGTLSSRRYERGLDKLESWADQVDTLEADNSSGPRTARGVAVMQSLDAELRQLTEGKYSLDNVAQALSREKVPVSLKQLRQVSESLAGRPLESLSDQRIAPD